MQHKSRSGSGNQVLLPNGAEPALLSESEYSAMNEKATALSREADDLRIKIRELETRYDTSKMTAKQHDKLVKQYLSKLFDVNRELLPLKERMQKDAEEREKQRIRQKLEAMGVKVKKTRRSKEPVRKTKSRAVAGTKTRKTRKRDKR